MKMETNITGKVMGSNRQIAALALILSGVVGLTFGQENGGGSINVMLAELQDSKRSTAKQIEIVKGLGQMGSGAAPALKVLLDPEFYLEEVKKNPPLKAAVIETLVRIGEPSVSAVFGFTVTTPSKPEQSGTAEKDPKKERKHDKRREAQRKAMQGEVDFLLRGMAQGGLDDEVIAALEKDLLAKKKLNSSSFETIGQMGPKAAPAILRVMKDRKYYNLSIIGPEPEALAAVNSRIAEHYTPEIWNESNRSKQEKFDFWQMSYAQPEPEQISALLEPVRNVGILRSDYFRAARLTGMMMSGYGKTPAPALAELLKTTDARSRRGAATILGMIGPNMTDVLPALEATMLNEKEAIDVRVAAARAIASIRGIDAADLYAKIPDVQEQIVALTREQRKAAQDPELWEKHLGSNSEKTLARHLSLYNKTKEWEQPFYLLATNREVEAQNRLVRQIIEKRLEDLALGDDGLVGSASDTEAHHFVLLFGADSRFFPGRLEPETEKLLKVFCFRVLDEMKTFEMGFLTSPGKSARYSIKTVEYFQHELAKENSARILEMSNGPMRYEANQHLILQILAGDPEFSGRKFQNGDTVADRYRLSSEVMARGMKGLALHGMWTELGSTNYEHKTYRGLLALAEFASDPVVATRAKMFMDLALVEAEQISISGLRGGSKSRCKDNGLTGRFNRYLAMFHGEYHGNLLELPGFEGYEPPVSAILLRKLGPTEPVYEIANRHVGEKGTLLSRQLNYAYCTPDYVMGCAMFDVRHWPMVDKYRHNRNGEIETYQGRELGYGTMGRWSGVVFRNSAAIELQAYTGEKYNVQSKDVMIAQIFKGASYTGNPQVDFVSITRMEESGDWVFVENLEAYAAVRPAEGGYYWAQPARRTMHLNAPYSPIIIQTGRKADYGSFEAFQKAILKAPLKVTEDVVDYTGPNSSRIEFFRCKDSDEFDEAYPKSLPRIDGQELDLNLTRNYSSPYLNNKVGSDVVTVTYGDREWEYDFGNNTIVEK
ncbi:MAG: hypothetical protein AAGA58_03685 [Verrucomicrobiota bacterium]